MCWVTEMSSLCCRRAHVTVHGGRRFTIVPGTTHVEPNHFGLAVGGVRFFDDDIAPDVGASLALFVIVCDDKFVGQES